MAFKIERMSLCLESHEPLSVESMSVERTAPAAPSITDPIVSWLERVCADAKPVAAVSGLLHARLRADWGPNPVWISRIDRAGLDEQLATLAALLAAAGGDPRALPLFGVPFAVKDNIDVAGFDTTAGCPAYAYAPERDAAVIARLRAAGAIVFGKANLDQFATGLNGTRSPYGAVANAADARYVSGGSSSGSAVAVARGEVLFALGTDTAGSGRVPATLNGVVGLKPTRGLLSNRGVVPACRSLDCVSVFTQGLDGAGRVLAVARGFDPADPYSRDPVRDGLVDAGWAAPDRLAVPANPVFFGDRLQEAAWQAALRRLERAGWQLVPIDDTPLREAAEMLYEGPWVAERDAAVGDFVRTHPDAVHPVVAAIVTGGTATARDAFESAYRLAELRRRVEPLWRDHAALLLPGTPGHCTIGDMLEDPVRLNSRLGVYTNFTNLLDLAALNLPATRREDRLPFGVSLVAAGFSDERLLGLAARLAPALGAEAPSPAAVAPAVTAVTADFAAGGGAAGPIEVSLDTSTAASIAADGHSVPIAVVGAHLSGLPLNVQLTSRGARLLARTCTAACYRLYALPGTNPPRPGMVRDATGAALEIEIWALPRAGWASFIEGIPAPLCIGSVETAAVGWVKGFLCEPHALAGAEEATALGGWRAYLASKNRN
jgi:allophanate hydrolase